jgi:hypothetical protein
MSIAYNKVKRIWTTTEDPQTLVSPNDWIVDPVFDDEQHANELGPNFWTFPGGSDIHVMTDEEIDVDPTFLAQAKLAKRDEINNYRSALLYGGFTDSNEISWNSGPVDIQNLSAIITLITAGVVTSDVTWTDLSNVGRTMSPAAMIQLGAELAVFGQTCYAVSWVHKNAVDALTSVSAVKNYDYSQGWPA